MIRPTCRAVAVNYLWLFGLAMLLIPLAGCDSALRTIDRIAELDPFAPLSPTPPPLLSDLQAPGEPSEPVQHLLTGIAQGHVDGNVEKLERLARGGDGSAFVALGRILREGLHRRRDMPRACRMFELAIEVGRPEGLLELGRCFLTGEGVPQDYERAAALFARASEKNVSTAHCYLGVMLSDGIGVRAGPKRAMQLCIKGRRGGDIRAKAYIGYWMVLGQGTEKNVDKGLSTMRSAVASGSSEAAALLGMVLLGGFEGVQTDIPAGVIFLRRSARSGNALGAFLYGVAQDAGYSEYAHDPIAVREWWLLAARQGINQAYAHLGAMHYEYALALTTPDPDRKRHVEDGLFWLRLAVQSLRESTVLLGLNMHDIERMRERLEAALTKVDEKALSRIDKRVEEWVAGRRGHTT